MTTLTFDAFAYAHQLREAGISEQQAELIAKNTSDILKMAVDTAKEEISTHELASRRDLKELELQLAILIERSKNNTLPWMFAMLSGFAAAILGVMAKGFHWI